MCPGFVSNSSSLPKRHHHPSLFLFFSLLLSSGRLDYVAKEIFLFLFFAFFTVSHWFGVNAFWMPLGVCRALGEEGSTGSCLVEEFQSEAVRWGSVWVKAQREALKWELKWFAELRNLSPLLFPPLFFRVTPSVAAHRCTVNLCFSYPKTNPWVKQTVFSLNKNMGKIVPRSHSSEI